jgi:hypothetical protein
VRRWRARWREPHLCATIIFREALPLAEFLAIHQSDASLLGCVLRSLAGKVSLGAPQPAAGVGFFQSDDVLLRKRPLAGSPDPARLAEGVESEAALICSGGVGLSSRAFNENTALPFRFKRWLFAAAGEPDTLNPIRGALVEGLPSFLRRSAKGDTAVEALFFNFLSRLRDAGRLDDHEVTAQTAAKALAAAVGAAERAFEQRGQPLPQLSLVATNGRVLAALRRGHPLLFGTIDGLIPCSRDEIAVGASDLDPKVKSHRMLRAAVVVSGAQPAPQGFRELAEGEVLAVSRTLLPETL